MLFEAIEAFIKQSNERESSDDIPPGASKPALELFETYCSATGVNDSDRITPALVRDFLARWYIEQAGACESPPVEIQSLLDSLSHFLAWAGERANIALEDCRMVISELEESLPHALEIGRALAKHLTGRGGAFSFPEFLTSFEEGGHSQYDIGPGGRAAALEGYFRILCIEGVLVEAVDLITDERVWPVIFPGDVALALGPGYIINLEIVRAQKGWEIAGGGLAYPPGTVII